MSCDVAFAEKLSAGITRPLTPAHIKRLTRYWTVRLPSPYTRDMIDLDLAARGLVAFDRSVDVTPAGLDVLAEIREQRVSRSKPHNGFSDRLGAWLVSEHQRMVWLNTEFRAEREATEFTSPGNKFVRPDVFSIVPKHDAKSISPQVHEVKVSRADFFADIANPEKRGAYLAIAGAVYYAAPEGMIEPSEVPPECGLVIETPAGKFVKLKAVRPRRVLLDSWCMLNLVLKKPTAESLEWSA